MTKEQSLLIDLINNVVFEKDLKTPVRGIDLGQVFFLSVSHSLSNIAYIGLKQNREKLGLSNQELEPFRGQYKGSLSFSSNQDFLLSELREILSKNKIRFMPLKGSVMKFYYPQTFYRTMSDIDILIADDNDALRRIDGILSENGFKNLGEKDKDKHFIKYMIPVEIHKTLASSDADDFEYFLGAWDRAVRKDDFEYEMTAEDFLIFHIRHMALHFKNGGIGVRFFLDLKICLDRFAADIDRDYCEGELKKLGLLKFARQSCRIARMWFGDEENARGSAPDERTRGGENARGGGPDGEIDDLFSEYVFNGGVYGNEHTSVAARKAIDSAAGKNSSKAAFIMRSVFPPYKMLKSSVLWVKTPILYPAGCAAYNLRRLKRLRTSRENAKIMLSVSDSNVEKVERLFKETGLLR